MIGIGERENCLKSCRLFSGMAPAAVRLLAESMETEIFAAMETVCRHGEEADRLYVVLAGRLAVLLTGAERPVQYLAAGDIFGEYGMFIGTRLATVRAEEESILLSLGYVQGRVFFLAQPEALMELLAVAARRLRAAEERFLFGPAE